METIKNGLVPSLESITNAKGVEFKLGDVIRAKGSKINRVIEQITEHHQTEVYATREDKNYASVYSAWVNINDAIKVEAA